MRQYNLDPELEPLKKIPAMIYKPLLPFINRFMRIIFRLSSDDTVIVKKYKIPGYKKGKIEVSVIEPKNHSAEKMPAMVFYHGGAFCLRASGAHYRLAKEYAARLSCKVIYADYRLSPQYPFPYGLEDCFAAYQWTLDHEKQLIIDTSKIIMGGDSAGGNLAIGVTILAEQRQQKLPKAELLIYPVTDRRMITPSMKEYTDTPLWNAVLNKKLWELYLKTGEYSIELASPIEKKSYTGFPQTYIEVAEYDCLRDEGIAFAEKLKQDQVEVELIKVSGACHGFETAVKSTITRKAMDRRIAYCKKIL